MSTTINNAAQLRGNIDLGSYEIQDHNLQKLGFFENIGRKIKDCVTSMFSSEARFAIATRNAEVARRITSLMVFNNDQAERPEVRAAAQRVTHQGIDAIKAKLDTVTMSAERRESVTVFLDSLHARVNQASSKRVLDLSGDFETIEKFLFTRFEGHTSENVNNGLSRAIRNALRFNGLDYSPGRDVAYAMEAGTQLSLGGVPFESDVDAATAEKGMKDFFGDDFEACSTLAAMCCDNATLKTWSNFTMPQSLRAWSTDNLMDMGVGPELKNLAVSFAKNDDTYTVTITGDTSFRNINFDGGRLRPLDFMQHNFTATLSIGPDEVQQLMAIAAPFRMKESVGEQLVAELQEKPLAVHVTVNHGLRTEP